MASVSYTDRSVEQTVRTNLVFNPRMDQDTSLWTYSAGGSATVSMTRSGSIATLGGQPMAYAYAVLTAGSSITYLDVRSTLAGLAPLVPGTTYTLSCWVNPTVTAGIGSVGMFIQWYNAAGTIVSTTSGSQAVPGAAWSRLSLTGVAPAGAVNAVLIFRVNGSIAVGDVMRVTGVLMEASPTMGDFFDGSTSNEGDLGYDWLGALDASASTETQTTVTAKLPDAGPGIRVSFTQADLDPTVSTATLYRIADGQTNPVRTAIDLFAVGGFTAFDAEAPVGIPVSYRALQFNAAGNQIGYSSTIVAELFAPDPMVGWISDPLDETSAIKVFLTDTSGTGPTRSIPGTVYQIGPQAHALLGVQNKITGLDMSFYCGSANDDAAVLALLQQSNGSVLMRTSPLFGVLIPRALYCFAGAATPAYLDGNGSRWTNPVSELSPTTQALVQSNASWADVIAAFPTWAALEAAFPSWLALEQAFDTQ